MGNPSKVTVSTGGIVLNPKGEILLVHQSAKTWSFPKGHVEINEDPLDAARREIIEEAGLSSLDFVKILGTYGRYKIGPNGGDDKNEWKVMTFFLFKANSNQETLKSEAHWIAPDKVETLLTHPKDKAFYKNTRSML